MVYGVNIIIVLVLSSQNEEPMNRENWLLRTNEPVEFKK